MDGVGVCQAMGTPGSLTRCLEEQQTPARWGTREEEQVGVEYKDAEKRCLVLRKSGMSLPKPTFSFSDLLGGLTELRKVVVFLSMVSYRKRITG